MQPKCFLYQILIYTLALLLGIVGINAFCLYHKINLPKSYIQALALEGQSPKALVLGSSRVRNIRTTSPSWPKTLQPVCSVFGPMETLSRMHAHIIHALEFSPLQEIVLCVDFFTFSTYNRGPPDALDAFFLTQALPPLGSKERSSSLYCFKMKRALRQIFSLSYLKSNSLSFYQHVQLELLAKFTKKEIQPGLNPKSSPDPAQPDSIDRTYLLESFTINETFFISPPKCFTFQPAEGLASSFETLRELLQFLYSHPKIVVKIVINPFHARFFELIHAAGLWSFYQEWLERLVQSVETEALNNNKAAYPIYDFSGYSPYNTEYLNTQQSMAGRWYIESSHCNSDLGDLMIERLYGSGASALEEKGFGRLIDSQNLQSHIQELEQGRQSYCENNPEVIAAIRKLYLEWKEANHALKIRKLYEAQSAYKP
jgi:hypothetical protein